MKPTALLVAALCCACHGSTPPEPSTTTSSASSGGEGAGGSASPWQPRCSDGWCFVPSGTFIMGTPEDEWGRGPSSEDQVQVTFTRSFILQQMELTREEWARFGWTFPPWDIGNGTGFCEEPTCPIGNLTWFEVLAYANALSRAEGRAECHGLSECTGAPGEKMRCDGLTMAAETVYGCTGYRLPTEAEWEYAARAGTTTAFYTGGITTQDEFSTCYNEPNLNDIAWYCKNSGPRTHPVGQKLPNALGFYDMLGNGAEWVHSDYHSGGYDWLETGQPLTDPLGELRPEEASRVFRGAAYNSWGDLMRCGAHLDAEGWFTGPGVRLARTLAADEKWPP